jgi:methyltransferase (TIGR00027 family)
MLSKANASGEAVLDNPVSKTAYYCAGTRMLDAGRPDSLLSDRYAERFMGAEGLAVFDGFRDQQVPIGVHQVRCYLIDELVRARLSADPQALVVLIGAGFDSRAFRLGAGQWVEIDEAGIIERKEAVAPSAACPNSLRRIAIDFAREPLAATLAPYATTRPVLVICEGVTMYLEPREVDALAEALKEIFPRHTLYADVMTRAFAERFASEMSRALAAIGTGFRGLESAPLARLERHGYRTSFRASLVERAMAMKRVPIPSLVRHFLWALPTMRDGYQVVALERGN